MQMAAFHLVSLNSQSFVLKKDIRVMFTLPTQCLVQNLLFQFIMRFLFPHCKAGATWAARQVTEVKCLRPR